MTTHLQSLADATPIEQFDIPFGTLAAIHYATMNLLYDHTLLFMRGALFSLPPLMVRASTFFSTLIALTS